MFRILCLLIFPCLEVCKRWAQLNHWPRNILVVFAKNLLSKYSCYPAPIYAATQDRLALEAGSMVSPSIMWHQRRDQGSAGSSTYRLLLLFARANKQDPTVCWLSDGYNPAAQHSTFWFPARIRQTQATQPGWTDRHSDACLRGSTAAPASSLWNHSAKSLKYRAVSKGSQLAFNWPEMNLNEIITGLLSKFKSD